MQQFSTCRTETHNTHHRKEIIVVLRALYYIGTEKGSKSSEKCGIRVKQVYEYQKIFVLISFSKI
jgi:hypothetical protein